MPMVNDCATSDRIVCCSPVCRKLDVRLCSGQIGLLLNSEVLWNVEKFELRKFVHIRGWCQALSLVALVMVGFQTATAELESIRVFTHGEGPFAAQLEDGRYVGQGMDLLSCSMQALQRPFIMDRATMARKPRMTQGEMMDAWLPSLVYGPVSRVSRIAYPIGTMSLYWYVPKTYEIDPKSDDFKKSARVSAFPGSTTENIINSLGFQVHKGTDDENIMVLRLVEGQLDGFLATSFESLLKPRMKALLDARIRRTLYGKFELGIEFTESFIRKNPGFVARFQVALKNCAD